MSIIKKGTAGHNKNFVLFSLIAIVSIILFTSCTSAQKLCVPEKQNDKEELKEKKEEFDIVQNKLMIELKSQLETGKAKIEKINRGFIITLFDDTLFSLSKLEINPDGKEILRKIANILKQDYVDKNISIEGHSDNESIKYSAWKSNWELSIAGANSVLHFLIDDCGMKPEVLRVTGFGEYRPIASNETEEGRQKNRRIEIIVLSE